MGIPKVAAPVLMWLLSPYLHSLLITILPPNCFSVFLPPLQLWYPILVPVLSSHQDVAMASSVPHLPSK